MARYICQGHFVDGTGRVIDEGTITVTEAGGTTAATIYEALTGAAASDNTVESDSTGKWLFFIDSGDYADTVRFRVVLSKTNQTSQTYDYVVIPRN